MLRSKDEQLLEDMSWVFEDSANDKYLSKTAGKSVKEGGQSVSYSTFPRCGNSFFRKYFQLITGLATGSDMSLELNVDMQMNMNKAEEITDDSVWLFKIHDPMPGRNACLTKCNKVLCCVRNPYDTLASMFIFHATMN